MSTAIVAGSAERVDPVVAALQTEGFHTIALGGDESITRVTATLPPSSVGYYVQMAHTPAAVGGVAAAGPLIGDLVSRLGDFTRAVPVLASDATVLIVADGWDERVLDAVRVLAQAAVANLVDDRVRISVLGQLHSAADVVAALRRAPSSPLPLSLLADAAPQLGFTDWRDEIMNATSDNTRSYFGWRSAQGHGRAVVLSGAVLSPLPAPAGWETDMSWGEPGAGSMALAESLLSDALGLDLRGYRPDAGEGAPAGVLSGLAAELAESFGKEVVQSLPAAGFELSLAEIVDWTRRHVCGDVPGSLAVAAASAGT